MSVLVYSSNNWVQVYRAALFTEGRNITICGEPTALWKQKILRAEHSPIRLLTLTVHMNGIPYFASVHFSRHKVGVEHFVVSQRSDRTGVKRDKMPQDAAVDHMMVLNAQALITMARKRLCRKADPVTRWWMAEIMVAVAKVEPELASSCGPDCWYRGQCHEMKPCRGNNKELI